jgi:23S rRNA pseudouridine1911/1915/1917 synthase
VLCDALYSGRSVVHRGLLAGTPGGGDAGPAVIARQALHAMRLVVAHPATQAPLELAAPLPEDMQRVLDVLRSG